MGKLNRYIMTEQLKERNEVNGPELILTTQEINLESEESIQVTIV